MRIITFDIETVGAMRGGFDPSQLELTICCIHDSETDTYDSFLKEDLPRLWKILETADMLVGYNSDHFDIPILNKYYSGELTNIKSLDLMKEVQSVLGRRIKLDAIAAGTLGTKKSGSGLDAITWWKEGNIKKLRDYCIKDVEITKRIFDYAPAIDYRAPRSRIVDVMRYSENGTPTPLLAKPAPDLTLRTTTTTGEAIEIEAALASRFAELTTPSRSEWYGDRAAYGTAARWFNEHGMLTRDARGGYKWREDYTDPTLRASFVRQFVDPGARSRARS
jgi:DEAD/DEAH box helicase domain-containing protein